MDKISYSEFVRRVNDTLRRRIMVASDNDMYSALSCLGVSCEECPFCEKNECAAVGLNKLVHAENMMTQELLDMI